MEVARAVADVSGERSCGVGVGDGSVPVWAAGAGPGAGGWSPGAGDLGVTAEGLDPGLLEFLAGVENVGAPWGPVMSRSPTSGRPGGPSVSWRGVLFVERASGGKGSSGVVELGWGDGGMCPCGWAGWPVLVLACVSWSMEGCRPAGA